MRDLYEKSFSSARPRPKNVFKKTAPTMHGILKPIWLKLAILVQVFVSTSEGCKAGSEWFTPTMLSKNVTPEWNFDAHHMRRIRPDAMSRQDSRYAQSRAKKPEDWWSMGDDQLLDRLHVEFYIGGDCQQFPMINPRTMESLDRKDFDICLLYTSDAADD